MDLHRALFGFALLATTVLAAGSPVGAWTYPITISGGGNTGCSVPKVARGSGGKVLVTFRRKNPDWRLLYRERSGAGIWGPVEIVSVPWSERPDIIEDPLGRPHMFYAQTGAGDKLDLMEAIRSGGGWSITTFTSTADYDEDYARMATDSTGNIHLIYTKTYDGDHGNVIYRVWNGSAWSGETSIGSIGGTGKAYYHRPDISVDSADNVHVVWESDPFSLVYRKRSAGSWSAQTTIGTTTRFFAYPKIAAATPSYIVVVTFDQLTQAALYYTYSTNGGTSWSALTYLNDGHYPSMDSYNNNAYLVYEWSGGTPTGFRSWNSTGWSPAVQCSVNLGWQGWADVVCGTDGAIHCVYDDASDHISYVTDTPDTIAPLAPAPFTATASDGSALLNWTNPSDLDFQGTMVRCKTTGYPTSATDGTLVCNLAGLPGSTGAYTHTGLTNGATYYYSAFARDSVPNYSSPPAHAIAAPHSLACLEAKQYADNTFVSLSGKVITANFISVDGSIYVEEPDRSSGIRVVTSQSGLLLGDRVGISGKMATVYNNGYPAERQIQATSVTRTSAGAELGPLAMKCYSIGGGPVGPLVPGVKDAVGLNNIGLLVKIAGRVTFKIADIFYVDDGTNIKDPMGRVGVMIQCPSSSIPVSVGNIVSVTGVVAGSIGGTWTTNRRSIRLRSYSTDLILIRP